jgi:hypothetical protein
MRSPTVIIDALLRGYNDGMDILTLSLGGADGWIEGPSGVVASRLADKGKVVTIAAGKLVSNFLSSLIVTPGRERWCLRSLVCLEPWHGS